MSVATVLLLAALAQAPVEDHIAAFLKGDAAARAELVKLGAFAIRPLQRAADKNPKAVDKLLYELKMMAAYPDRDGLPPLGSIVTLKHTIDFAKDPDSWFFRSKAEVEVWFDSASLADLKSTEAAIEVKDGPVYAIFDQIRRQTGLDYGFFHHVVVIAKPERLWPPGPPEKPAPLARTQQDRATRLIEQLGDASIESRDAAAKELLHLGPSVVELLENGLGLRNPEISVRCRQLIERLQPCVWVAYGEPPAIRRYRDTKEQEVLDRLKEISLTFMVTDITLGEVVRLLGQQAEVPMSLADEFAKRLGGLSLKKRSAFDILVLVTQNQGLDFIIENGGVVVGKFDRPSRKDK